MSVPIDIDARIDWLVGVWRGCAREGRVGVGIIIAQVLQGIDPQWELRLPESDPPPLPEWVSAMARIEALEAQVAKPREKYEANRERLQALTLAEAERELSSAVYSAALLFERLEGVGSVRGNGHHVAQNIAQKAVDELRYRWQGPR